MTVQGVVNARLEAVIALRLRGPDGAEEVVEAVIDTGYTGSLIIPASTVAMLGLDQRSGGRAILADGTACKFQSFAVDVHFDDGWQGVVASAVGEQPLVGMRLLSDHELRIEAKAGGAVTVTPLSPADEP